MISISTIMILAGVSGILLLVFVIIMLSYLVKINARLQKNEQRTDDIISEIEVANNKLDKLYERIDQSSTTSSRHRDDFDMHNQYKKLKNGINLLETQLTSIQGVFSVIKEEVKQLEGQVTELIEEFKRLSIHTKPTEKKIAEKEDKLADEFPPIVDDGSIEIQAPPEVFIQTPAREHVTENQEITEELPMVMDLPLKLESNQPINLESILEMLNSYGFPESRVLLNKMQYRQYDQEFSNLLSQLYVKLFNSADQKIIQLVETILTRQFKYKITHARQNVNVTNYSGFIPVRYTNRHSLTDIEKAKIGDVHQVPDKTGLIIKEIYPRIEHQGKVISQGKILIS